MRDDDSRRSMSRFKKLWHKSIHLLRRLTIVMVRPYLKRFARQPLPILSKINRILIIPHDPVGDLLLTEPIWRKLKTEKPDLQIGIAVSSRNRELANIYTEIDAVYNLYGGSILDRWREARRARKGNYDVILVPVGFYKPVRFALISRYIAGRHGFTATMHSARATRYAELYSYCTKRHWQPHPRPMVEQYEALVERVFQVHYEEGERAPRITLPGATLVWGREQVSHVRQKIGATHVFLAHLEAKVEDREWGLENVERLLAEFPHSEIIVTASPLYWEKYSTSRPVSDRISRIQTHSVLEAAALVAAVDLVISPDTALVHFAAALGTPVVAFYPSLDEWLPYHARSVVLIPKRWEPISSIGVADVKYAILNLLHA